jgi:hypothetical protein
VADSLSATNANSPSHALGVSICRGIVAAASRISAPAPDPGNKGWSPALTAGA